MATCRKTLTAIFAVSFLAAFAPASAIEGDSALELLDGHTVRLVGHMETRTFFGPPGYGENPGSDSRETVPILFLENTLAEVVPQLAGTRFGDEITVHLILNEMPPMLQQDGPHCVALSGVLVPRLTGHHHTAVLIDVEELQRCTKQ